MSETFSVGEIAILCNAKWKFHFNGKECEIVGPLQYRSYNHTPTNAVCHDWCYLALIEGEEHCVLPTQLRKKKPPREDLTVISWDSVPWWPEALVRNVKEPTHD